MALTCEPRDQVKTAKIRVILIHEEVLKHIIDEKLHEIKEPKKALGIPADSSKRWKVLCQIAESYQIKPTHTRKNTKMMIQGVEQHNDELYRIELCTQA